MPADGVSMPDAVFGVCKHLFVRLMCINCIQANMSLGAG
jgi:hypothetical protein